MEDLGLPEGVQYTEPYVPSVRECAYHKIKYRVDCADAGVGALQLFQHCANDPGEYLTGPLLGAYEWRDGKWVTMRLPSAA
jgi:hypothetical protein